MTESITIAIITSGISLVGIIYSYNKMSNLIIYRIEQLEKKQDKHNGLIERMYKVEDSAKSAHHRIDEIKNS